MCYIVRSRGSITVCVKSLEWAEPASVYIVGYNLGTVNALTDATTYYSCMAASPPLNPGPRVLNYGGS